MLNSIKILILITSLKDIKKLNIVFLIKRKNLIYNKFNKIIILPKKDQINKKWKVMLFIVKMVM